jgi:hypothetical protein
MTPNERKDWLKKLKNVKGYEKAVEESKDLGGNLPDGKYTATVKSASLNTSQNGRDQIIIKLQITGDEEQEGAGAVAFHGIDENSLRFTVSMLRRLGFEVEGEDPTELLDIVDQLSKSEMSVNIKVKDGFANILDSNEEDIAITSEEDEGDDDGESHDESEEEESEEDETSEEDDSDESSEDNEVSEGKHVTWKGEDGKKKIGEVIEVLEDKNIARVELEDGKIVRVNIEKLSLIAGEEEENDSSEEEQEEDNEEVEETEEEVLPKKKAAKKVTKVAQKKKTSKRK